MEMTRMMSYRARNQRQKWNIDTDGMLRCKTSILPCGILEYDITELGEQEIPATVRQKGYASLYIPPEEINDPESIRSLEGKPIKLDHVWGYSDTDIGGVGAVAGTPYYSDDTKLLYADILINNLDVIKRVTALDESDRLVEQSAAYITETDWTPGITPEGTPFDGIQRDIRYNHVMLLKQGEGRAGKDVRIINKQTRSAENMSFTKIKIGNSLISVANEDVHRLQNEIDDKDEKINNAIDGERLEESMNKVDDLNKQIEALTSERDSLRGELVTVKEQLEDVTNPDNMSDMVEEAVVEQGDADEILEAYNAADEESRDDKVSKDDKVGNKGGKVTNPGAHARRMNKKLFGHALRLKVVNSVRKVQKREHLSDELSKNQDIVKGMFSALKDSVSMVKNKKSVANGASVVKALNSNVETKILSATDKVNMRYESHQKRSKK